MKTLATVHWEKGSANDNIKAYCKQNGIEFRYNQYFQLEILINGEWQCTDYQCPDKDSLQILLK